MYYAKSDGFPTNKVAGKPCDNLMPDFHCSIHSKLIDCKLKGCLAYDCFGAGQKVTYDIYAKNNWRTTPSVANQMFEVFLIVYKLHQMLWYLIEASTIIYAKNIKQNINILILENQQMTQLKPEEILSLDIDEYHIRVNQVLKEVTTLVSVALNGYPNVEKEKNFMGKDFKKANLNGKDFSMSLLIAANLEGCNLNGANFLGADLRDINIKNTDLSESIFLTQSQINTAKGNRNTKLPSTLIYPSSW